MALIPGGQVVIGTNSTDKEEKWVDYGIVKPWFLDEQPAHKLNIDTFFIDITEVTNKEFKIFIDKTGRTPPSDWKNNNYPDGMGEHPVIYVNWFDADEYCKWKGKRLPSENEWEKAAKGTDERIFPWGNEFDINKANVGGIKGNTMPVKNFETGKSPYGLYDMTGNVWEWTSDWYKGYQGNPYQNDKFGEKYKVLRGNSWAGIGHYSKEIFSEVIAHNSRITFRLFLDPKMGLNDIGFRCVKSY